ncbi:HmuY family protein [Halosquirtibacter laminarini]|uniref:HmuY family protein n=1 Tax=Halosquirtibacter laminarini TaxID=3374600 RepID=A0AC61NFY1_9BACT|nr:HmuY family protein [Prolixibacteraceae bacterium]
MKNLYIQILFCITLLPCCVKYDALPFEGKTLPRKTAYGNDWLYYNLASDTYLNPTSSSDTLVDIGATLIEGEQKDRVDWDIAFNRYNIRTNSGLSGHGNAGAFDMGKIPYESIMKVNQIPTDAQFTEDTEYQITMSEQMWNTYFYKQNNEPWFDPNEGPKQMKSTANALLGNALRFKGPPPAYITSNHVYIVRSADGKEYYKLMIISWYSQYKKIGERGGLISFKCDKLSY